MHNAHPQIHTLVHTIDIDMRTYACLSPCHVLATQLRSYRPQQTTLTALRRVVSPPHPHPQGDELGVESPAPLLGCGEEGEWSEGVSVLRPVLSLLLCWGFPPTLKSPTGCGVLRAAPEAAGRGGSLQHPLNSGVPSSIHTHMQLTHSSKVSPLSSMTPCLPFSLHRAVGLCSDTRKFYLGKLHLEEFRAHSWLCTFGSIRDHMRFLVIEFGLAMCKASAFLDVQCL